MTGEREKRLTRVARECEKEERRILSLSLMYSSQVCVCVYIYTGPTAAANSSQPCLRCVSGRRPLLHTQLSCGMKERERERRERVYICAYIYIYIYAQRVYWPPRVLLSPSLAFFSFFRSSFALALARSLIYFPPAAYTAGSLISYPFSARAARSGPAKNFSRLSARSSFSSSMSSTRGSV